MPVQAIAKIVGKEKLTEGIYKFSMKCKEIAETAKPGNFLEIKVSDSYEPFLRRPISIYNIDKENDVIEFIFQVKGKGTKMLMERKIGEDLDILGPLGYGTFDTKGHKKAYILGGGIGVFPLYELAKELTEEKTDVTVYMGFKTKDLVTLETEFEDVSNKLVITTDDGSYKEKGFAIDFMKEDCKKEKPDIIYACGPLPMLKLVQEFANAENIRCQMSLEERMGCGIQACVGCAVKVVKNGNENYEYVCKQGPVFDSKDVVI